RVFIEAPDVRQISRAGECRPAVAEALVVVDADEVAELGTHVAEPPLGVDHLAGQAGVLECPRGFGERRIRRERVRISLRFHSAPNLAADPLPCRTPDRVKADVDLAAPPRRVLDPRRGKPLPDPEGVPRDRARLPARPSRAGDLERRRRDRRRERRAPVANAAIRPPLAAPPSL